MGIPQRFKGRRGDFDFFAGTFRVHNRRLRQRHVGSSDWDEFEAVDRGFTLLDGAVSVDQIEFTSRGWSGCTIRTLDAAKALWSLYWINGRSGILQPPVHGGFDGDAGEFLGMDFDEGVPVFVRFVWQRTPIHRPRWEQAFSLDGRNWETNWTMDFERIA